jgi:type II secretory pathway pseudopilin PulG
MHMRMRAQLAAIRSEEGIGLIELLIAMTILVVGVAATLSVFSSSIIGLRHTGQEGTAISLADRQLESYRAMPFSCIPVPGNFPPATKPTGCATPSGFPDPYLATQVTTSAESPDHRIYKVTTAVSTAAGSATQILVTVALNSGGGTLAQETSYFSSAGTSANG